MLREILQYINFSYPKYKHHEDRVIKSYNIKSALCYQWLYKKYFGKNIDLLEIIYTFDLDTVNPFRDFEIKSNEIRDHLIFSHAFFLFTKDIKLVQDTAIHLIVVIYFLKSHQFLVILQGLCIGCLIKEFVSKS